MLDMFFVTKNQYNFGIWVKKMMGLITQTDIEAPKQIAQF